MATDGTKDVTLWPFSGDTHDMAWFAKHGAHVGPSLIPGAGDGVFTRVHLPRDTLLGWYRGELIDEDEYARRYPRGTRATYVLEVNGSDGALFVDARNPAHRNWTAMVNDAHGTGFKINCAITASGAIKTTRAIAAGSELLISYGKAYWRY